MYLFLKKIGSCPQSTSQLTHCGISPCDTHSIHAWGYLLNLSRFCSFNCSWMQANQGEMFPGTWVDILIPPVRPPPTPYFKPGFSGFSGTIDNLWSKSFKGNVIAILIHFILSYNWYPYYCNFLNTILKSHLYHSLSLLNTGLLSKLDY